MIYKVTALCYTDHTGQLFPLRIRLAPVPPGSGSAGASRCGMRERSGSHQRRRVRARDPPASGTASRSPPGASPARTIARRRSSADRSGAAGGAGPHTPGRAAGGAQGTPPFSTKLAKFAICRKAPLHGGDRDRAHGSRRGKRLIGLPGTYRLSHP